VINRKFFLEQVGLRLFDGKLPAKATDTQTSSGLSSSWR
jgi:hypothetical protein